MIFDRARYYITIAGYDIGYTPKASGFNIEIIIPALLMVTAFSYIRLNNIKKRYKMISLCN